MGQYFFYYVDSTSGVNGAIIGTGLLFLCWWLRWYLNMREISLNKSEQDAYWVLWNRIDEYG